VVSNLHVWVEPAKPASSETAPPESSVRSNSWGVRSPSAECSRQVLNQSSGRGLRQTQPGSCRWHAAGRVLGIAHSGRRASRARSRCPPSSRAAAGFPCRIIRRSPSWAAVRAVPAVHQARAELDDLVRRVLDRLLAQRLDVAHRQAAHERADHRRLQRLGPQQLRRPGNCLEANASAASRTCGISTDSSPSAVWTRARSVCAARSRGCAARADTGADARNESGPATRRTRPRPRAG
jgi:hypothetical protein